MKSHRSNGFAILLISIVFLFGIRSALKGAEDIPQQATCSDKCEVDWEREAITMPLEEYQDLCREVQEWRKRHEESK